MREVVAFDGQVEPYLDLELGRLDAVLLDSIIALYYASTNPKLKYVGAPSHRGEYAIALRPDDEDLAAALDEALGELDARRAVAGRSSAAGICGTKTRSPSRTGPTSRRAARAGL